MRGLLVHWQVQARVAVLRYTCRNLIGYELGVKGAAALAPVLQQLTGLTCLGLRGNNLSPAGMAALAPALQLLTGLRRL